MTKKDPVVFEVVLKFKKSDIQQILNTATDVLGMDPVEYDDLTPKQLKLLKKQFGAEEFIIEIIESTEDAVANDWLADFLDEVGDEE